MSSTGRKKVDEAILDYLSDLLTPPADDREPVRDGASGMGAPTGSVPEPESGGRTRKSDGSASGRSSTAREVSSPSAAATRAASRPPQPARVALAEKPRLRPKLDVRLSVAVPDEAPASAAAPAAPAPQQESAPGRTRTDQKTPSRPETGPPAAEPPETGRPEPDQPEPDQRVGATRQREAGEGAAPGSTYPAWAGERFDVLLFEVAGLKLAVPLVTLGNIHPLDRALTHLFGMPDWFMGILPNGEVNIKVVDTALWVMPEKYDPAMRESVRFVVTLHGTEWGLACHVIHRSISLNRDEVKWRVNRAKRPWLAGTVVRHMCALLDVEALAGLLRSEESGQRPDGARKK